MLRAVLIVPRALLSRTVLVVLRDLLPRTALIVLGALLPSAVLIVLGALLHCAVLIVLGALLPARCVDCAAWPTRGSQSSIDSVTFSSPLFPPLLMFCFEGNACRHQRCVL